MKRKMIVVGMSGGVDSSVSAALLQEEGHQVIGLFMRNWEEQDSSCGAVQDFDDVLRTCEKLNIPAYSVNFTQEYRERVFASFLSDLRSGLTPNPDVLCNREIKFDLLLKKAEELGAERLATGHYCRIDSEGRLLRGLDPDKDQSYFLHAVSKDSLRKVCFPIGHLRKKEVRSLAQARGLPSADKKDSTGICFIGKRDFKSFVSQYLGYEKGEFRTLSGTFVGSHDGTAFYTIGQRRGLGLGGEGKAWYVVGKDLGQNIVFVERGDNHPALFSSSLIASKLSWVDEPPKIFPYRCTAKIRYRQSDQLCVLQEVSEKSLEVRFETPQRAVTPGQFVVFYEGQRCLGGGVIEEARGPLREAFAPDHRE